jgi:hypothetical protein
MDNNYKKIKKDLISKLDNIIIKIDNDIKFNKRMRFINKMKNEIIIDDKSVG